MQPKGTKGSVTEGTQPGGSYAIGPTMWVLCAGPGNTHHGKGLTHTTSTSSL
jgi:hypothetical protein